ncbi:MAG TPA: CAP domain-containing protein [Terriglobales bacterium]|nr:CAP domain-containing protein [Terriglobales bacterium]
MKRLTSALASCLLLAYSFAAPLALEHELLTFMNVARADARYHAETQGLAHPLTWNAAVAEVALRHSEEMARNHTLSHTSNRGLDVGQRLDAAGITWSSAGENVALASSVEQVENMIMREPPFQANHRGNVLNRHFTEVGIGIARAGAQLYVTEDFLSH